MKTHEKYLEESNPVQKALDKQKKSNSSAVGKNRTSYSLLSTAIMEKATRMGETLWIVTSDQDMYLMEIYDKNIAYAIAKNFKIRMM